MSLLYQFAFKEVILIHNFVPTLTGTQSVSEEMYLWSYGREERFRPRRGLPCPAPWDENPWNKKVLAQHDRPWRGLPSATIPKDWWTPDRGPFRDGDSHFPWASAHGYYWVAPAGLGAVPPSHAYEEIFKSSHFFENELVLRS